MSEIWHIPSISNNAKRKLLSASAQPLKFCHYKYDRNISFNCLHSTLKRATPTQIMTYKHALLLHKVYNDETISPEWQDLFFNQTFNNRSPNANFIDTSRFKQGKNLLINRFTCINNLIPYNVLNLKYGAFKIWCKNKFKWLPCSEGDNMNR